LSRGDGLSETLSRIEGRLLATSASSKKLEAELESWQDQCEQLWQRVSALPAL
jgi:hypothetical protein